MTEDIQVLEGLEPIRLRPEMYVGKISEDTLTCLVEEVMCVALDQATRGETSFIEVRSIGGGMSIYNDGVFPIQHRDGAPHFDYLTRLYACRAAKRGESKSFCNHGLAVVNALSEEFSIGTRTVDKTTYSQRFKKGKELEPVHVFQGGVDIAPYTRIRFNPDLEIFSGLRFNIEKIRERCHDFMAEIPKLRITVYSGG